MKRTVIVGVGNPILGDDGVGIHVARELKGRSDIEADIREGYTGGLNLLDLIIGYERAILVDAVYLDDMKTGEVKVLDIDDFGTAHSSNPHDATLMEAIEMSKSMGEDKVPSEIKVVGIRIDRTDEFSEVLSPEVAGAVGSAVEAVEDLIGP